MTKLSVSVFKPEGDPKAIVEVVHGMAEHHHRYDAFATYLANRGYIVYTYDLPGHGKSVEEGEVRGWFGEYDGLDQLIESINTVRKQAVADNPNLPFFIFAHSMGTIVTRCYLQKYDDLVSGVVLSGAPNYQSAAAAGIGLGKILSIFKGKRGHSKLMDQMVTGNFNNVIENPRTPVDWLSYNEDNVDQYIKDEDCGFGFTIQGYIDELTGIIRMHDESLFQMKNEALPIHLFAGEDDPCIGKEDGIKDSVQTLLDAGYKDVTYHLWKGMRHETLNEKENEKVFAYTADWFDEHLKSLN